MDTLRGIIVSPRLLPPMGRHHGPSLPVNLAGSNRFWVPVSKVSWCEVMGLQASKNGKIKEEKSQCNVKEERPQGTGTAEVKSFHSAPNANNMLVAVRTGDLKGLQSLVQAAQDHQSFDINRIGDDAGRTLLDEACWFEHANVVRYLLGLKADVNARNLFGWTVFHYSCWSGNVEIAQLLINSKALINSRNNQGVTPLMFACKKGCLPLVKLLVERNAKVNAHDSHGERPLHFAARFGHLPTVTYLVDDVKVDVNAVDNQNGGPLHVAASSGHLSTVKYLVENVKADITAVNKKGETPLKTASGVEVKQYLHQAETALNLFQAVKTKCPTKVQRLISKLPHSFIERELDNQGNTLQHVACENDDSEIVQILLNAKASIETRRKDGKTPLLIACDRGHVQAVKRLVKLKADVNVVDSNGNGPLHCASYNGHMKVIKFMVDGLNVDINSALNKQDQTPLDAALSAKKLDVANYFNHKRLHRAVTSGHVEETKAILQTAQPKVDIDQPTDNKGTTYLYLACEKQNLKLSRLLLESKASIQGHMPDGRTLLLVACARGHLAAAKTLVDQKADVKAADNEGYGPIHLACLNRDLNMAKYFVESCKLDIEAISKQGKTALSLAREVKGEALVSYVEGVIVNGKKVTESRICVFDKGLVRTWLLRTQGLSQIESSVIQMLYDEEVDGSHLLSLARDPKMREAFPKLKPVQWMNIRKFLKSIFDLDYDRTQFSTGNIQGTFGPLKVFAPDEVNLKDSKRIGEGNYGYALLVRVVGISKPVVLKRNYYPVKSFKSFHAICNMGSHPNILDIIGLVTLHDNEICLISEYCEKGSLENLARKKEIEPSDKVLLGYANQILHGLKHLHSRDIIHRDLRAANILVHNERVVIADYGLSRKLPPKGNYKGESKQRLPEHWMAPEGLRDKMFTFKGDIWSFGVTLYELMTYGRSPYDAELKRDAWENIRKGVIDGSIRLIDENFRGESLPEPSRVIGIAKKCLDIDESTRPDAMQVLGLVEEAMDLRTVSTYS
ncbi:hypothetical protein AAMO2058_001250700 [Amorphochlora amoebiformis]